MTQWNTEAVVLRADAQGESDLRVQVLTPGRGRMSVVAKGALRSKKRFMGTFEPCNLVFAGLMTAPRSGRILVEHASVIKQFPDFREDALRLARASLLVEMTLLGTPELEPCARVFELVKTGLSRLHEEPDNDRWAAAYSYRLLAQLGYKPGLDCCVHCRGEPRGRSMIFDSATGGILCQRCCEHEEALGVDTSRSMKFVLSLDTARTLTEIMKASEDRLSRINFTRNALAQAMAILPHFISYHLHRPAKSLQFMKGPRENHI